MLFCKCVWGDPFARFKSVQVLTGQHLWSWEHSSLLDILKRLTVGPTKLLLKEYGTIAAFAFFSLWVTPKSLRFWAYYTVFTVLFFWFGTTSFSHYEPIPLVSRMTLPSLPGFCILGAYFASRLRISSNRSQRTNNVLVTFFILSVTSLPFLNYVNSWRFESLSEAHAIATVRKEVAKEQDRKFLLVCSDSRSPKSLAFYFGYKYPRNLVVISAANLDHDRLLGSDKVFIFLDEN